MKETPKAITRLRDLTPDAANANKHTPRGTSMMETSIREVGFGDSLTVDRNGVVISGNQRLETLADVGLDDPIVVQTDGKRPVVHQRIDLEASDPRAKRLALFSNRVGQVNLEWDVDVLKRLQDDGVSLDGLWGDDELRELLADAGPVEGLTDPDAVPEERPTDIVLGDLFALGDHRLLCGDSTKAEDVARVMGAETAALCLTDPPYGVNYAERNMARDGNAAVTLAYHEGVGAEPLEALRFTPSVVLMSYPIDRHFYSLASTLASCGYEFNRELVWVKSRPLIVLGSYYNQQHEPILLLAKKGHAINANSRMTLSTVFTTDKETAHADHPTAKPMELWAALLENHSDPGSCVYEPFSGSGTTIIACEQLRRRCFAVEIEPRYVQVALDRWEAFTGKKAVKL